MTRHFLQNCPAQKSPARRPAGQRTRRLSGHRARRLWPGLLAFCLLLTLPLAGCSRAPKRYTTVWFDLFDTVTTVVGYADSEEEWEAQTQALYADLLALHQLFDIYHHYDGVVNLYDLNQTAAAGPVAVDARLFGLLQTAAGLAQRTGGKTNIALGPVLALWHEARTAGLENPAAARLPDQAALSEAALHCGINDLVLDPEAQTVFYADPLLRLDVGAVAKGWAVEQVCRAAPAGLLVSVGGNVRATGPKPEGNSPWVVGVQDPDGGKQDYLHTLNINRQSVVSSGDYQRYYTVDGVRYHHIIDPDTLRPGQLWRAVTVVCPDSGLADGLSTALFLLPREEGAALAERCGAQAMWVAPDGGLLYTDGFLELVRT